MNPLLSDVAAVYVQRGKQLQEQNVVFVVLCESTPAFARRHYFRQCAIELEQLLRQQENAHPCSKFADYRLPIEIEQEINRRIDICLDMTDDRKDLERELSSYQVMSDLLENKDIDMDRIDTVAVRALFMRTLAVSHPMHALVAHKQNRNRIPGHVAMAPRDFVLLLRHLQSYTDYLPVDEYVNSVYDFYVNG